MRQRATLEENSEYVTESGCLLWNGSLNSDGRGRIGYLGKSLQVHRLAYEKEFGTIPEGMHVLHKCDVPSCINPQHLFLGTHQDNMEDRYQKGRYKGKLSKEQVAQIKADPRYHLDIARQYGVSRPHITGIKSGNSHARRGV